MKHNKEVKISTLQNYTQLVVENLNDFLTKKSKSLKVNGVVYEKILFGRFRVVKIYFDEVKKPLKKSQENFTGFFSRLDYKEPYTPKQKLFYLEQQNFYDDYKIYIIRPDIHRFWTKKKAWQEHLEIIGRAINEDYTEKKILYEKIKN